MSAKVIKVIRTVMRRRNPARLRFIIVKPKLTEKLLRKTINPIQDGELPLLVERQRWPSRVAQSPD